MSQIMVGSMNDNMYLFNTDSGELTPYDKPDDKGIMLLDTLKFDGTGQFCGGTLL